MNKMNRIWILAIVLIALLPSVFAQTPVTMDNVKFIAINAMVIGIVLWILQTFLIPQKADNEKKVVGLVVFIGSLVIAWFYGNSGYIWQSGPLLMVFNKWVLVNSIIIGAAIYLTLGFMKFEQLKSPQGQAGYALLIFLVSIIIAVRIGQMWIWSNDMVKALTTFLFYVDTDGYGGILNPFSPHYKLWIFVTLFTIISFFFSNFLLKGKESKMNYALALLLSGHMAYNGISANNVIIIGEIVFLVILQESLKDTIKTPWLRWVVAGVLVLWAGYAISSATGHPGISGVVLGGSTSKVGGAVGGVAYGIGWIIKAIGILIIGVLAYMGIKKAVPGGTP